MPIRDYSLQLNDAFFKEMKHMLENIVSTQKPNQDPKRETFCQYLLTKYTDCAAHTQTPETTCQSEMELLFLTHCATILKNDNQDHSN